MSLTGLGEVSDLVNTVVNKIWPDKTQAEKDQMALALQQAQAELQQATAQTDIDKIEAASPSLLVSGWRPALGWVGVVSFALVYVPKAIVLCGLWSYQAISVIHGWDGHATLVLPSYPDLGVTDIIGLLGTLLGVGGMRTYEKTQGVNNRHG